MWTLIKALLLILAVILLVNHPLFSTNWETVFAFFGSIINWVVYWMKAAIAAVPTL